MNLTINFWFLTVVAVAGVCLILWAAYALRYRPLQRKSPACVGGAEGWYKWVSTITSDSLKSL